MNPEYFSMSDAARVLHTQSYRISYLLSTRQIPEPMRIGGRRVFTTADLTRISEVLDLELARTLQVKGRRSK